jgi:hypothetical protein
LGYLPLALEQAAAYIEETGQSMAGYLALFRKRRVELLRRGQPAAYPDTVATTWELAFQQVQQSAPAGAPCATCVLPTSPWAARVWVSAAGWPEVNCLCRSASNFSRPVKWGLRAWGTFQMAGRAGALRPAETSAV